MDLNQKYGEAADEYVTLRQQMNPTIQCDQDLYDEAPPPLPVVGDQDLYDEAPPPLPVKIREKKHRSKSQTEKTQNIKSQSKLSASFSEYRTPVTKASTATDKVDIPFEEYLKTNGINETTLNKLKEEDISDLSNLRDLTEEDINGLGLKLGQKALIRKLTLKGGIEPVPVEEEDSDVKLDYYCMNLDGQGKVVAEIRTKQPNKLSPIKTRILILVDVSGSMGIRSGRKRRYSKLYRIKGFAKYMVDSLDDGDFAGLVTFGETANVLLPMTEITQESRDNLKSILDTLDKSILSTKTDLSAGLSKALDVFREAGSRGNDLFNFRNTILVFSDGEVNAGTQNPNELVHEVRGKIRKLSAGLDESLNQWVSISTVVLGKSASEIMYCLSKFCSSDAFYSIDLDVDKNNSEMDLFLPVLLRKSAVAWNVSVNVEALNGAVLINENCSQENKVRPLNQSAMGPRTTKAYFFYDIPAASLKHIGIGINLEEALEEDVMKICVEYSGFYGTRQTIEKIVKRSEIIQIAKSGKTITEHYKNDARMMSETYLGKAAKAALSGNVEKTALDIQKGKSELQKLMNKYGQMASNDETDTAKGNIEKYARSLMQNMEGLLQTVQPTNAVDELSSLSEKSWLKIKSVSSAISRETPGLSDTVSDGDTLCPLPDMNLSESEPLQDAYQKVRESMFFDFDGVIEDLKSSFKKD